MAMRALGVPESNHCHIILPGVVTLKARTTVMVLAKVVEKDTVKMSQKLICWRMQVAVLGRPKKRKEQRQHRMREMSRM